MVAFSRRHVLQAGAALTLPLGLTACDSWAARPVAVAAHPWVGYLPMFMAQDRGWLDASQVSLVPTSHAQASIDALRSGRVQAAALTLDEALTVRASALPISIVLVFNVSMGADALLVRPGISALAELKGQRIGYEGSSVAEIMLTEILQRAGLQRQDIELVTALSDEHMALWQRRRVDALITYEPVATRLLAKGMTRLFDSQQIPNTIVDVLALRHDAQGSAYAGAVRHLLAAHLKAVDSIRRNPQDAAYRLSGRLGLPAEAVMGAFRGLEVPDASRNFYLLGGSQPQLLPVVDRVIGILKLQGQGSAAIRSDDLLDASYLPTEDLLK